MSASSALPTLVKTLSVQMQRMSAMWVATAASRHHAESPVWADPHRSDLGYPIGCRGCSDGRFEPVLIDAAMAMNFGFRAIEANRNHWGRTRT